MVEGAVFGPPFSFGAGSAKVETSSLEHAPQLPMNKVFDIAVIGGGVVGLAILRFLALAGQRAVLLERGPDILSGASKGNSALLHTGFDAPPGSLELSCMKEGRAEYLAIRERLNLPLLETSALVVAWSEEERAKLATIAAKAATNGIDDVHELSRAELAAAEPRLSPEALAALRVPGEHVIDPWSAPLAYGHQAIAHGAEIRRNCEVTGGEFRRGYWRLKAGGEEVAARIVVNAAGNFGDLVEAMARQPTFRILPRRGQFIVFDKPAHDLVGAIILPVPTARTKGVVLFRTIFGNLAIGPTAEDVEEREVAACDGETLDRLRVRAIAMVPALAGIGINAIYAGLRPASERSDYIIEALPKQNWITVAGIRSTGLTSALGIARHVGRLHDAHFGTLTPREPSSWTPVANLAEHLPRPYATGGSIICHC
ncbi:MAG: NAD(P)/FAD-dependent oxidoreductase, partial [Alphaproteobacteria bacterium]|nr:NAD(P)/FAD-dependent oxidoreductase [Alphaproteobacteria bacterium]